jgi:hypothetical protein
MLIITQFTDKSVMKTKILLLLTSLAFVAISASGTGIFSPNAVGYVNVEVPANGYALLGNPLNGNNGTDNSLNTIIPLPHDGSFDGASVYRFDCVAQSYRDTMQWVSTQGWLAGAPGDLIINPGEGFFIQNVATVPMPITFLGEVPTGNNLTIPVPGNNKYCILASKVPKAARLGWVGDSASDTHEFPACTGDSIFIYYPPTQSYRDTHQYVDGPGWLHSLDPLEGPLIDVAQGFFMQKVCADAIWSQTYSVGE